MNTKKNVLVISFFGSIFLLFLFFLETDTCYKNIFCEKIQNFLGNENLTVFFLAPIVLFFSIITYFLRNSTFLAWGKFTIWWVVVSFLLVLISPSDTRGWLISPNVKELVMFFSAGGYMFFATFLVLYKSWKLRKGDQSGDTRSEI